MNTEKERDHNTKWWLFRSEKYRGIANPELEVSKGIPGEMALGYDLDVRRKPGQNSTSPSTKRKREEALGKGKSMCILSFKN